MKISYQGIPGAYSYITAQHVAQMMKDKKAELVPYKNFSEVWKSVDKETIAVLPIENSRAGSVHDNLYNFMRYKYTIIGEVSTDINHALLSKECDIGSIKKAYSHRQALSQCHSFLKKHHIEGIEYFDTAGAAQFVAECEETGVAAIASEEAGKLYGLHVIQKEIQDQKGNSTRFLVIADKESSFSYPQQS
jgi:prephenate dehydratase